MSPPLGPFSKKSLPAGLPESPDGTAGSELTSYIASLFDPALTWRDIEWLAGITKLPVLVKGILRSDDALLAVKHGASGIIVSNHGARQLDTAPATISVLPELVDVVGDKVEVYVDDVSGAVPTYLGRSLAVRALSLSDALSYGAWLMVPRLVLGMFWK